jgi:hypothetical protein
VHTKLQIPQQVGWFPCRLSDCFQSGLTGDQHPESLSIRSKGLFKHLHNKPHHCRHANDAQQRPRLSSISIIPLRKMSIKAKPRHSSSTGLRSILPVHPHDSGAATKTQQPESAISKTISNIERLLQEVVRVVGQALEDEEKQNKIPKHAPSSPRRSSKDTKLTAFAFVEHFDEDNGLLATHQKARVRVSLL